MTTRRQVLAAAVAAPIIAASSTAPAAGLACLPIADTAEWDAAFARYQSAKDDDERFYREVYRPEMGPLDHLEPPYNITHVARNGHAFTYSIDPRYHEYDTSRIGEWHFLRQEIEEAKEKCAAYAAAMPASRRSYLNQTTDELGNAAYDARWSLFRTPAPNLGALEYKLRMLKEASADSVIDPSEIEQIIKDVELIGGQADQGGAL